MEDLIDLVSMLPWWVGLILAIVSYFVLHSLATSPSPIASGAPLKPADVQSMLFSSMGKSLAFAGQFLLPMVCVLGAGVSAWRRHQRKTLVVDVAQSHAANALDNMTWHQFELLVGEAFRRQGYTVSEIGGNGPDGGIDLILAKGREKFFVQCKQWKAFPVGVAIVRELYGVMAAKGATGGFVVTSGKFTADAIAFAHGRNIELIDGAKLLGWIRQVNVAQSATPVSVPSPSQPPGATPACPLCFMTMVRRSARRGASAGQPFWGCSGYPACKGTRSID